MRSEELHELLCSSVGFVPQDDGEDESTDVVVRLSDLRALVDAAWEAQAAAAAAEREASRYRDLCEGFITESLEKNAATVALIAVFTCQPQTVPALFGTIYEWLGADGLICMALDKAQPLGVRATAVRVLFANIDDEHALRLLHLFGYHPNSLIRHGVVLGLADVEAYHLIYQFTMDESELVSTEATEILSQLWYGHRSDGTRRTMSDGALREWVGNGGEAK